MSAHLEEAQRMKPSVIWKVQHIEWAFVEILRGLHFITCEVSSSFSLPFSLVSLPCSGWYISKQCWVWGTSICKTPWRNHLNCCVSHQFPMPPLGCSGHWWSVHLVYHIQLMRLVHFVLCHQDVVRYDQTSKDRKYMIHHHFFVLRVTHRDWLCSPLDHWMSRAHLWAIPTPGFGSVEQRAISCFRDDVEQGWKREVVIPGQQDVYWDPLRYCCCSHRFHKCIIVFACICAWERELQVIRFYNIGRMWSWTH